MKKVLPEYMIPAYLIKLEEIHIAPTGKIDRKKLENIDIQPFFMQDILGPRNETEEILIRELGKEFLLEKFDIREDIFTIGASSLKILNALAKLKPHFPMLSIQDFYKNRTVENLSQYINGKDKGVLISGFTNPLLFIFDDEEDMKGNLVVKNSIPSCSLDGLTVEEIKDYIMANKTIEYGHTLEDQIQGQINAGFVINGLYEDDFEGSRPLDKYIKCFIATKAVKIMIEC